MVRDTRSGDTYLEASNFERRDFNRAAVFLWIILNFTALSITDTVCVRVFADGLLRYDFTAVRSVLRCVAVRFVTIRSCFNFFFARLIIGIVVDKYT